MRKSLFHLPRWFVLHAEREEEEEEEEEAGRERQERSDEKDTHLCEGILLCVTHECTKTRINNWFARWEEAAR